MFCLKTGNWHYDRFYRGFLWLLNDIMTHLAGLRDTVPHRDAAGKITFNIESGELLQTLLDPQQACLMGTMVEWQGPGMTINTQHVRGAFYAK